MELVSVLTPSLNYARFIEDAILSVQLQEGVKVEHVIQDGGSSDGTVEILKKHSEISWESAPDRGQSDALNKALRRARGDWIAWLNADEFLFPGALAHLLNHALISNADVVYGDCIFVDEDGRFLRLRTAHDYNKLVLWHYGPFIPSCAVLIRRKCLGTDPWNINVELIMDWQLYLDLAEKGAKFYWTPYPVGTFRVHAAQISAMDKRRFAKSYDLLTKLYGARPNKLSYEIGRLIHGILKLKNGGYNRERRASIFKGRDLRWFVNNQGMKNFEDLLEACYT